MNNGISLIVLILFLSSLVFAKNIILPESTVAVVNGIAIFEDDLDREVESLMPNLYIHSNVDPEKIEILKEKAMKSLIEHNLLYSYAKSIGIKVEESEVEDVMKKYNDIFGSELALIKSLTKSKYTIDEFKKRVKKDLTLHKLYEKEIEYKLTDKQLKDYYEKNIYKFKEPEKIKVSMIYVKNNPTDPDGKDKAKDTISKAAEELKKGENFSYVAQTYSNDPSRVVGGDLGWLHRGRLNITVENIAFSMDKNTTSTVIEKDVGYFIVKVIDKKEQNLLPFDKVKDGLKNDLKKKEEDKRKEKLLEQLTSKAVIIK